MNIEEFFPGIIEISISNLITFTAIEMTVSKIATIQTPNPVKSQLIMVHKWLYNCIYIILYLNK